MHSIVNRKNDIGKTPIGVVGLEKKIIVTKTGSVGKLMSETTDSYVREDSDVFETSLARDEQTRKEEVRQLSSRKDKGDGADHPSDASSPITSP